LSKREAPRAEKGIRAAANKGNALKNRPPFLLSTWFISTNLFYGFVNKDPIH
jgi:hypothetical protein